MDKRDALTVLIGREPELQILLQALHSAGQGAGSCFLIAGEAGIGKSRLARELAQQASVQGFAVVKGDCFEQNASYPYGPWLDALRATLGPLSAEEAQELLGPLAPVLLKVLPELSFVLPDIVPATPLDPVAEKHRLFEAFARFLVRLSASHPVLLVLEDLHWSDALSLELIQYAVRRFPGQSVMMIATYRPDGLTPALDGLVSELTRQRLAQRIDLKSLQPGQIEQLTRALLKAKNGIPTRLLQTVVTLSEGNPFFVEEVASSLTEQLAIDKPARELQVDDLPVPGSIQHMVQDRVERLTGATQQILTHASVIGHRFDFAVLQATAAQGEKDVLVALREAMDASLVIQESADTFAFRHILIREAVYAKLLRRERRAMHQAVGDTLERGANDRHRPPAADLAYHFFQAGWWQKAMEYSQQAGEQALGLYAPHEALVHFARAIASARELGIPPLHSCLRGRAQASEMLGEFESARLDNEAALELAQDAADRAAEWQSLVDLGFLWQSRAWERSGTYFERAHALARSLEETALIAETLGHIGYWRALGGQLREALSDHEQALGHFRLLDDRRGMARTLELMALDCYAGGDCIQGAVYCEEAVAMLRGLDDRQSLANALSTLGFRVRLDTEVMGEIDMRALAAHCDESLEIAYGCDYRVGEAAALHEGAACLSRAGEFGRAWQHLGQALSIAEELEHQELLASVHLAWGSEFCLGLLDFAQAREHLEAARVAAQQRGSPVSTLHATASLAHACILEGDLARARQLLDTLTNAELVDATGLSALLRGSWVARAELELASGAPGRALEIVERLLASTVNLAQYGPQAVPRLSQLRGQALVALARTEEAATDFLGALLVAQKQGQRSLAWQLHRDLGKAYRLLGRREAAQGEFSSARAIIQLLADSLPPGELRTRFTGKALAELPLVPALTPRQAANKAFGGLTDRERAVAALIARGRSNREIADALVITVRTVEAHITRILAKLGFKSRTEIAAWAVAKGLAAIPGDSPP